MRLYLVRHGKAERDSSSGLGRDRPLRPRGERQARWLAEQWAAAPADERPRLVLSSGFVRAMETARIIVGVLGCPLIHAKELEIGRPVSDALRLVARRAAESSGREPFALVGHNPQLEHLLGILTGAPDDAPGLRTGQAAALEVPAGEPAPARLLGLFRLEECDEPRGTDGD